MLSQAIQLINDQLELFPDDEDLGLYQRGLYDGYMNSLNILAQLNLKPIDEDDSYLFNAT